MKKKLTIVIPAFNEAQYIPKLIKKIFKINLSRYDISKEIVLVDDGSTDNTKKIVKKFKKIRYMKQTNQGKGKAVQKGIKKAKGSIVLVQDADLEYDPRDYIKLIKPFLAKKKIAVYGSRYINKNIFSFEFNKKNKQSYLAFIFNYFLSFYFYILFGKYYSDLLTGYKVYEKSFFNKINIKTAGFETDHEITVKLIKQGYDIIEVPVRYNSRSKKEGKKINIFDAFKALTLITRMRFTI